MSKEDRSAPKTGWVSIDTREDRAYWAGAFNVSEALLVKAVELVGRSVEDLRKLFLPD
jgi:hypothetical protein